MTKTEHYQLNQWDPEDPVRRTDFNEDNAKLDVAIANCFRPDNLPWVVGSYVGTGAASSDSQDITLGFKPKLVIILGPSSTLGMAASCGGVTNSLNTIFVSINGDLSSGELSLTERGFRVLRSGSNSRSLNYKDRAYVYFAL